MTRHAIVKSSQALTCLLMNIIVGSLTLSTPTHADIYRWVDADGNLVYGDQPTTSAPTELIKSDEEIEEENSKFGIANEHRKAQKAFAKSAEAQRLERKKARAEQKKRAAKQAARCKNLQARLKHRQRINKLFRYKENGEVYYLSEAERQASDQRLREATQKACEKS